MKKEQIQVGKVYAAKVSGSVVPVRITAEKWQGEKHVGWSGVNVRTNKSVRIKSAQRLRNEVGPTPPDDGQAGSRAPGGTEGARAAQAGTSPNGAKKGGRAAKAPKTEGKPAKAPKAAKEPKAAKPAKPRRVSAIDAAARVLAEAGKPMKAREMVEAMEAKGLWKSPGGKTPEATLYAAIIREISAKKKDARFRKTERGTFEATGAGKGE